MALTVSMFWQVHIYLCSSRDCGGRTTAVQKLQYKRKKMKKKNEKILLNGRKIYRSDQRFIR